MLRKPRLFTAGPTPLHPEAVRAAAGDVPYHRTAAFSEVLGRVQQGLQSAFRTRQPVALLAASGTGGMEAAVANLFTAGNRVAVVVGGKFGQRWAEIAHAYGLQAFALELAPGQVATPERVADYVATHRPLAGLLMTASETSTGTLFDSRGIAAAVREVDPGLAVVVDAITAIGAVAVETDAWELDAVVGGSQKAFMVPPGLAFVACSARGWERVGRPRTTPRYYLDLRRYAEAAGRRQTPFTPAIGLVQALDGALAAIDEAGGITALEANAARLADATRAAAAALDLELLSAAPSPAVTALRAPRPGSAPQLVARMRERFGAQLSGGQGGLKPDVFRIGHIGWVDELDLLGLLGALETVLIEQGHTVQRGAGVAAAATRLAESVESLEER